MLILRGWSKSKNSLTHRINGMRTHFIASHGEGGVSLMCSTMVGMMTQHAASNRQKAARLAMRVPLGKLAARKTQTFQV